MGRPLQLEHRAAERDRVHRLALGEEPLGDAALIEQLDRAGVESAPTSACQTLRLAPLEDDDVHPRQPQLASQHHPRRPAPDDHHIVHLDLAPCVPAP